MRAYSSTTSMSTCKTRPWDSPWASFIAGERLACMSYRWLGRLTGIVRAYKKDRGANAAAL